jgi:DNA-directed RNA polymerase sigma subunit (sigma70/sigma32)
MNYLAQDLINKLVADSAFHMIANELNEHELAIVALRFGLVSRPKNLTEVADIFSTERLYIRRTESNAMAKLSKSTRERISTHLKAHHPNVLEDRNGD